MTVGTDTTNDDPSEPRRVTIAYVRPGRCALDWVAQTVAGLKEADRLRPVTVLVPNEYAGRMVGWFLAQRGGFANVRSMRLTEAAALLVRGSLPPSRHALNAIVEEGAVRDAARRHRDVFGETEHRALHHALLELFRELRRREVNPDDLEQAAPSRVTRAALAAYQHFRERTAQYLDPTDVVNLATDRLAQARTMPRALARLGALVLYLPTRFDPSYARFLAAVARWVPVRAGFSYLADPQELADRHAFADADLLARASGVPTPPLPPRPTALEPRAETRVIRAPDPAEEVREVVRQIAADVESDVPTVPLHRMAILYRQLDPYASLVRDALNAAGFPWSSLEGHRLDESRPGRSLLLLLRLPERHFAPSAVVEWLETGPVVDVLKSVSISEWNRLARAANIFRGAAQWTERLNALALQFEAEFRRREQDGATESSLTALARQIASAKHLAEFMSELGKALRPPRDGSPWSAFVDWTLALWDRYVGRPDDWPAPEQPYARDVLATIERLRETDQIDTERGTSFGTFVGTLQGALESQSRQVGRLGHGIMVGPVAAVTGLTFDRVYLLGLTEGAFPPPLSVDPFFPIGGPDPLDRRSWQRCVERRAFLTAVATADGGRLTLSTPDSDGGRAAFPSRWLLEVASVSAQQPLDTSTFATLSERDNPWLRVIPSALNAAQRAPAPADLEDRRLREIVRWRGDGLPLIEHALAQRVDLPLGDALRALAARRSTEFTEFDGNVNAFVDRASRVARIFRSGRPISASAIETWAVCPFRFFLGYVLGVEPTEHRDDEWTIDPMQRGTLIHAILEEFFRTRRRESRVVTSRPLTSREATTGASSDGVEEHQDAAERDEFDREAALLEAIAARHFQAAEALGATGHPLVWENVRTSILADLRAFLVVDRQWRLTHGLTPTRFEQGFGIGRTGDWPPLVINRQGVSLRFRGIIDRIDLDPGGRRAFVFDYKTGRADGYAGLDADPVLAGHSVQLALYTRAVRENLGGDLRVGGAYWFVTSRGEFKQVAIPDDAALVDARLEEVLDVVAAGIGAGAFPQVPGVDDESHHANCRYCEYDRICPISRDEIWQRKRSNPLVRLTEKLARRAED